MVINVISGCSEKEGNWLVPEKIFRPGSWNGFSKEVMHIIINVVKRFLISDDPRRKCK